MRRDGSIDRDRDITIGEMETVLREGEGKTITTNAGAQHGGVMTTWRIRCCPVAWQNSI